MNKKKEKRQIITMMLIMCVVFWMFTTITIQASKCPEMTTTELIINIPKSFTLNFKNCY